MEKAHCLQSTPKALSRYLRKCIISISNNKQTIPFAVRSNDCLPAPSKEFTLEMLGGISLSSIGPIRLQICNKWSGATCLLDSTWQNIKVLNTCTAHPEKMNLKAWIFIEVFGQCLICVNSNYKTKNLPCRALVYWIHKCSPRMGEL